ncbi:MAG: hypothetical protein HY818_00390 [Acetobacterium woodii]|nr:hypothetical protein [Acetobacterium woodii]
MEEKTIVTTCTRDCPNTCGLLAHVKDGKVSIDDKGQKRKSLG